MFNADEKAKYALPKWDAFRKAVQPSSRVAAIYHADLDGLVGTSYAAHALNVSNPSIEILPRWVTTDDYSFVGLFDWLKKVRPECALFCDVSIESHPNILNAIAELVSGPILIFDDHEITGIPVELPDNVSLINPRLKPEQPDLASFPSFLFAYIVARASALQFPNWLLVLCLFVEGVAEFYPDESAQLIGMAECSDMTALRTAFRRHEISRASSLIRAEFSLAEQEHVAYRTLWDVASNRIESPGEFIEELRPRLEPQAKRIGGMISSLIDAAEAYVRSPLHSTPTSFLIRLNTPYAVIGPVCSVLRGKFSQHVFIGQTAGHGHATYELRCAERSDLNLVTLLENVAELVPLISFGGHPSGAGALVAVENADTFERNILSRLSAQGFATEVLDGKALLLDQSHRKLGHSR